jgi:energy-coupling factor transporter ATP-binding protein EcfA2
MIELSRLTYFYPDSSAPALTDLDLVIGAGEMWLVAGRSGAGKSTLLGTVNGLVPHFYGGRFAGRAVVAHRDTRHVQPVDLAAVVGTVFQEPGSRFVTRSVGDEIAFGLEAARYPGDEIAHRVDEIVERLSLGALMDRPLDRLSGGEQQRVAIAAAMGRRPSILVLDEPTSQLDGESADATIDWIIDLRREFGLTALLSEHRLARLAMKVDRVAYLGEQGRLIYAGLPEDVLPRLPYGPALFEAARRMGCPPPFSLGARDDLRTRILTAAASMTAPHEVSGGPPRLTAQGLNYAYNGVRALNRVEIGVRPGEMVAILGRNGSGKTTLLRCLMGLLRPQAGEVRLDGQSLADRPVAETARSIAFVPQWPSASLFAESVREELVFTLRNHGMLDTPPVDPNGLLDRLDLAEVAGRYPRDLSSGERQRVALAAVLVTHPSVLFLDEPTLGMDPIAQAHLGELLESWKAEGMAVLLATHDVEFAAAHAERALVLDRGEVRAFGPTAETLFAHVELRTAMQLLTGRARPATWQALPVTAGDGGKHANG